MQLQQQQAQFQASQQLAAAVASAAAAAAQPVNATQVASILPSTTAATVVGQFSLIDQLRHRQQLLFATGVPDQALALETVIRQHQQVDVANALQQHQQQQASTS